jgi:hypothetical protein
MRKLWEVLRSCRPTGRDRSKEELRMPGRLALLEACAARFASGVSPDGVLVDPCGDEACSGGSRRFLRFSGSLIFCKTDIEEDTEAKERQQHWQSNPTHALAPKAWL